VRHELERFNGREVDIFKAVPAPEMELVSTIKLDYYPAGLYVKGDRLAVFGSSYDVKPLKEYSKLVPGRNSYFADMRVYDVSDRKAPRQEKQYDFEGSFRDSRLIGDYLYFVTETTPAYSAYRNYPMPYVMEDGAVAGMGKVPAIYYFDASYNSQNMTSVSAVNLQDLSAEVKTETYVLDGYQNNMYVSEKNLYLTFSKYVSETEMTIAVIRDYMATKLSAEDQAKIREIEGVQDYILSPAEKAGKVMGFYTAYIYSQDENAQKQIQQEITARIKARYKEIVGETQKTVVHKVGISGNTLTYAGKGAVPGRVINQYAMDEDGAGNLRVATTVNGSWIQFGGEQLPSYNNLFVLGVDMSSGRGGGSGRRRNHPVGALPGRAGLHGHFQAHGSALRDRSGGRQRAQGAGPAQGAGLFHLSPSLRGKHADRAGAERGRPRHGDRRHQAFPFRCQRRI
jgi:hypothetical protein